MLCCIYYPKYRLKQPSCINYLINEIKKNLDYNDNNNNSNSLLINSKVCRNLRKPSLNVLNSLTSCKSVEFKTEIVLK